MESTNFRGLKFDLRLELCAAVCAHEYGKVLNSRFRITPARAIDALLLELHVNMFRMAQGLAAFRTTGCESLVEPLTRPVFESFVSIVILQSESFCCVDQRGGKRSTHVWNSDLLQTAYLRYRRKEQLEMKILAASALMGHDKLDMKRDSLRSRLTEFEEELESWPEEDKRLLNVDRRRWRTWHNQKLEDSLVLVKDLLPENISNHQIVKFIAKNARMLSKRMSSLLHVGEEIPRLDAPELPDGAKVMCDVRSNNFFAASMASWLVLLSSELLALRFGDSEVYGAILKGAQEFASQKSYETVPCFVLPAILEDWDKSVSNALWIHAVSQ